MKYAVIYQIQLLQTWAGGRVASPPTKDLQRSDLTAILYESVIESVSKTSQGGHGGDYL